MMTPFLTDDELAMATRPLTQPAAQRRFFNRQGVPFIVRPDGRPLVSRDALAGLLVAGGGGVQSAGPNAAALIARFGRKRKNGATT